MYRVRDTVLARSAMVASGYSQRGLADQLGASKSTVNGVLTGARRADEHLAQAMADALNVSRDRLFREEPGRTVYTRPPAFMAS